MHRLSRLVLLTTGAAAILLSTTLQQLSLDDMIQKSTVVVRGRVTGSYAAMAGVDIFTYYHVQVSETWKGPSAAQLDVGAAGWVHGGPRTAGDRVPIGARGTQHHLV